MILEFLRRLFGRKEQDSEVESDSAPRDRSNLEKSNGPLPLPKGGSAPSSSARPVAGAAKAKDQGTLSAEERCGITPEMTPDQVRNSLAALYRRHNRAASSLDPDLRAEAEIMLEAIVDLREKLDPS